MSNETKKVCLVAVGSCLAGVIVTFLLMHFCCCLCGHHKRPQIMPMAPQQQMMMQHKHHGMHRPEMRHHGKSHHRQAFDHKFHEPSAEMKAKFAEKLGLTDEQKAQLEQYRREDMAQIEPLFKQMDELRGQLRELREAGRAHFESVLTDEQKEILKTMKKKHNKQPRVFGEQPVEHEGE